MQKKDDILLYANWMRGRFGFAVVLIDNPETTPLLALNLKDAFHAAGQKSRVVSLEDMVSETGVRPQPPEEVLVMDLTQGKSFARQMAILNRARSAFERTLKQPLFLLTTEKSMTDFVTYGPDVMTVATVFDTTDFSPY